MMARFIMRILSAAAPYGRTPAPGGRERALVYLVMEYGIVIYFTQSTDSVNPGLPCALNKPLKARNMGGRAYRHLGRRSLGLDLALNRIVSCFRPLRWAFTRSRPPDVFPRGGGGQRLTGKNYACHP